MHFRIEGIQPMRGEELRAALEERRDHWARVTLQDDQDPAYLASEEAVMSARARTGLRPDGSIAGLGAGEVPVDAAENIRVACERQRELIRIQNLTPGPDMQGAIALMTKGIADAVSTSEAFDCLVRVTIEGEYNVNTAPTRLTGGRKRLAVKVDDASLG